MISLGQAREFFRFELRQLTRHPTFWLSLVACVAAGVAFSATDLGTLQVGAGRVRRNVPYAVVTSLAGLSALGMFVVLICVGQAALRDFSTRSAALIFSRPVRPGSYLAGRLAAGYCAALAAVLAGALAMVSTQLFLADSDPEIGPVPWLAWSYGIVVIVLPNLLLLASLVFLLALWTRSMGATFLGLLLIMIGQDVAEALPVAIFGSRLPALLDPLGLAALSSVSRSWTASQYADSIPGLGGDLLLNRALWGCLSLLFCGLAGVVFSLRARREDLGSGRAKPAIEPETLRAGALQRLPASRPQQGAGVERRQFWAILRFELGRMGSSMTFRVLLLSGVAMLCFTMFRGERVLGVRSLPGSRVLALALGHAAKLTLTMLVVVFSGEVVWRERSTRMALTLDALPTATRVHVAGKLAALAALVCGTLALYAGVAWALQTAAAGQPAQPSHVLVALAHESAGYVQLAAVALLLQTLAGGRMAGYLAFGIFLALRLALRAMGHTAELYSLAGVRLPLSSDMDGWGHTWPRVLLTHGYWLCVAAVAALLAGLLWPRGVPMSMGARLAQARRRASPRVWASLALALAASSTLGVCLFRVTLAPGASWDRDRLEAFAVDYEVEYGAWRDRLRPELVSIEADVDLRSAERRLRVRGRYELRNQHAQPIESMLLSYDPDLELLGLGFAARGANAELEFGALISARDAAQRPLVEGVIAGGGELAGTHVVRFDPPLAPGATVGLDFDLQLAELGLGARPADTWLRENGSLLMCGVGTHPFFRGAHVFPKLGYDSARELRATRARSRRGLEPWAGLIDAQEFERRRALAAEDGTRSSGLPSLDWAEVQLWVHTDLDQTPLAPGELVRRSQSDGRKHSHFRSRGPLPAFFPIVCGRYELVSAQQGEVSIELYHHAAHTQRVPHILWAVQRSLAYFEEHWGPYPRASLRLGEIPGGNTFAASFPGVMAFAEGTAFLAPAGAGHALEFPPANSPEASNEDVDPILWFVAHEVAHQWWDSYVIEAPALGASLVSESLAQYGSLCVVQEEYGREVALRMARHNRELYLSGRSSADRAERALIDVDEQDHLHYGKGFVAFHALFDLAGRGPIDRVLAQLIEEYGGAQGRALTSVALVDALRRGLPAELVTNVDELLGGIEFVETSLSSASVSELGDERHALVVECSVRGVRVDADGEELEFEYGGPLELEVLFEDSEESAWLEALASSGRARFEASFDELPTRVRLDPRLHHIDRDLGDNELSVLEIDR